MLTCENGTWCLSESHDQLFKSKRAPWSVSPCLLPPHLAGLAEITSSLLQKTTITSLAPVGRTLCSAGTAAAPGEAGHVLFTRPIRRTAKPSTQIMLTFGSTLQRCGELSYRLATSAFHCVCSSRKVFFFFFFFLQMQKTICLYIRHFST